DRTHLDRNFQFPDQVTIVVLVPLCQRGVATAAGSVSVRARLDRAPVVAGGQGHGVDAVHDALVVGCCPVGIDAGKVIGHDDAVAHLLAVEALAGQAVN